MVFLHEVQTGDLLLQVIGRWPDVNITAILDRVTKICNVMSQEISQVNSKSFSDIPVCTPAAACQQSQAS